MTNASICTIGDEILIGQIVDTNSSRISRALEEIGIKVTRMLSIGDDSEEIITNLDNELRHNGIVVTTGGLGPTRDDITKAALAALSGSSTYIQNDTQLEIIHSILQARGLDVLDINKAAGPRAGHMRGDSQPPWYRPCHGIQVPRGKIRASVHSIFPARCPVRG